MTRRSRRALSGISGFSMRRSVKPRMAVRGLLTSWATPETNCPTAAIFSACTSLERSMAESVTSVMTTTMLVTRPSSPLMGLRLTENWALTPSPRISGRSKLSTCWPRATAASASRSATRRGTQVGQRMRENLVLLKTEAAPAPVGITDDAFGVGDQNQALGMAEDLAGKITLFLKLGLGLAEAGDIEHEAAVLQDAAGRIAHRETVDEYVNGRSILAPQNFFLIAQSVLAFEKVCQFFPPPRRKIDLGGDVELNDFFAAAVAEDANHGIVDFHEAALGGREENSFLNVIEELAIAALGFAAVGDVLEHVDGLELGAAGGMNARGRNQVGAFEDGMNVFVEPFAGAAEGTGVWRSGGGKGFERAHVDPDQLVGGDANEIGESAIDAENVVLLVMDDDEVADGIEDFKPVAVSLLHAGKEAGILESDAGMAGDGAQQLVIFNGGRSAAVGEAKHAHEFSRGAGEPDQGAICPSQSVGESGAEDIGGGGEGDIGGVFRQSSTERLTKAAQQLLVVNLTAGFGGAAHEDGIEFSGLEKAEGGGATAEQTGRAQSEVAHELGQMEDGVEFEGDGNQGLGAAAMLLGLVQVMGKFESDGNLSGQSAGAADVFVVNRTGLDAVEHSEHPEHIAVRTEQGDSEELADMKSTDEIQVGAWNLGGVFGEEDTFLFQRAGRDAVVERDIDGTGQAVLHSPSNVKGGVVEEPDEAAPEPEETGGTA